MGARPLRIVLAVVLATTTVAFSPATPHASASLDGTGLVISQVYGGGGNVGATLTHDFIEIFNPTANPISLNGKSVQYASSTGTGSFGSTSNVISELPNVSLGAGQYYLIQESQGVNPGTALPTPDLVDATPISMAAGAGKVALVNSATSLGCNGGSAPCDTAQLALIIDLIGYGSATNFSEGTPTNVLDATTSAQRNGGGCIDTNNNLNDFTIAGPAPRNTATVAHSCERSLSVSDVALAEGNAGTTNFVFTVTLSAAAGPGGVTFDIATADGSASSTSDYTAQSLTGQAIAEGGTTYQFTVAVNGDTAIETDEGFTVNVTNPSGASINDGQGAGTIQNDDTDFCVLPYTPIYSIQGTTDAPLITGNVTTQGVVVGDFEGTAAGSGFYLQDLTGDGNAATSDGIFVFTGATDLVSVGQVVRVTGFARERFNQTTINGSNSNSAAVPAANIVNCGTATTPAPVDITLPWASATAPEALEGMLVRFPQDLVIAEYFNYARFGEMVLANPLAGETRPFTGTAIDEPGAAANARTAANALSRITLDDAQSAQNPATLRHPNGAAFSLANTFRGGDTVTNAVGVLGFDFSLYRIVPTGPAQYTAVNTRPLAPEDPGGSLRFAAMNTLNFFITADYPTGDPLDNKCGGLANLECRGWDFDQPTEFSRQRDKLVQAIAGLDADVVGLNELENTPGVDALADPQGIVAGLNAIFGAGTYAYINTGVIGTDAIRVGLIYRPAVVTPVGAFKLLTTAVDPRFIDTKSRPVLAQTFRDNVTGEMITVAVNHLKSKGSDCLDVGDPDALDGQGNCNITRRNAARALVDWLASDPTGSGDPDFLILGDLNSYAMEDPIDAVLAGADDTPSTSDDYTNLIKQFQGTYAHSYVFDGQAGYLDYALASASLVSQVTGAADWHINSDEPSILDYDTTFKPPTQDALYEPNAYRSSDHDPVVVGLDLGGDTAKLRPDPVTPSLQSLFVNGSSDNDVIYITQVGGLVRVRFGDTVVGDYAVSGRVIVIGHGGDDNVLVDSKLLTAAFVYGGDGDDILSATSNRDNVLVGGDGADTLVGGQGRDLLVGGAGADSAAGGKGDDILIGGRTQFDAPVPAGQQGLLSVLNTWSGGGSYGSRVAAAAAVLGAVIDADPDGLTGGQGSDWFVASSDDTTDVAKGETKTAT